MLSKVILFLFSLAFFLVEGRQFPSYIEKCHIRDANVQNCFRRVVEQLKLRFKSGIPEFGLPPLVPLRISQIALNDDNNFKANFRNVRLYHLDQLQIEDLIVNVDKNYVHLEVNFPKLRIQSEFDLKGRLLFLNLNGRGPADVNFTNVHVVADISGRRYLKNGREHIEFTDLKFKEHIHKPSLLFQGLFPNNPELNYQINQVVNENIFEVINELNPSLHDAVNQTVVGLLSYMFSKFPVAELFPQ